MATSPIRVCLRRMECGHTSWQCDYHGRRVLFYPRHVLCSGRAVTQLTTVILLLARRSHGLRRFATLLAGNAAALSDGRADIDIKSTRCTLTLFITQLRFYLLPVRI